VNFETKYNSQRKSYSKGILMSKMIRTVEYCELKIIKELSKRKSIVSYLSLSKRILEGGVRGLEEKHNLDTAIGRLIFSGKIRMDKDDKGIRRYCLARKK
jgi:hypothetical protein